MKFKPKGNRRWLYGVYNIENEEKYKGKKRPNYKSSYERKFMYFLDHHPDIVGWSYEDIKLPYFCQIDKSKHMYYLDFSVKTINPNTGDEERFLVEVKPESQTKKPDKKKYRSKRKYITDVHTYIVNKNKWDSAIAFCKSKGLIFKIITEKHLNGVDILNKNMLYL